MADPDEVNLIEEERKHRDASVRRIIETVRACGDNPQVQEFVAAELEFSYIRGHGVGVLEGIEQMAVSAEKIVSDVFGKAAT